MASEAACDLSTVLEAPRVASTARSLVPGECRAISRVPRDEALHDSATPTYGFPAEDASWGAANPKSEIRNSKFEIRSASSSILFIAITVALAIVQIVGNGNGSR
jgi:hypothetical protein